MCITEKLNHMQTNQDYKVLRRLFNELWERMRVHGWDYAHPEIMALRARYLALDARLREERQC